MGCYNLLLDNFFKFLQQRQKFTLNSTGLLFFSLKYLCLELEMPIPCKSLTCMKLLGYLGPLLHVICVCLNLFCGKCLFKERFSVAMLSVMGTLNFCGFGCWFSCNQDSRFNWRTWSDWTFPDSSSTFSLPFVVWCVK